ncbi:hypothetical protein ACS0TY_020636 [Phlomoides rotata]
MIEHTFGLLNTHNQIIMACCLLHNYIRKEMSVDPLEHNLDEFINFHWIHLLMALRMISRRAARLAESRVKKRRKL